MPAFSRRPCQPDFDVWQTATKEILRFFDRGIACFGRTRQWHTAREDIGQQHTRAKFKHHQLPQLTQDEIEHCKNLVFFFPLLAKSITTHWAPRHANKHFAQVQPKLHCRTQAHAKLAPKQRLPWSCSQVAQHTASCTQHQDHTTQITETLRKTPRYPDKATLSRVKLSPMPTLATRLRNIIGDSTPPWGTPLLSQPSTTPGDLHLLGRNNCGRHLSLSACHLKNPSAKISVRTNAVPPL